MRTLPRLYPALLLTAAVACAPMQTADTSAAAKTAIDAINGNWVRLTSTGHADSIAEFYTANAVILPPNMSPMRGREAIRGFFATMNPLKPNLAIRADSVWGSGNAAVEQGRWNWSWPAGAKAPAGMPAADSGKYIVRWVNENGHWLIAQDIWNSDVPLPMPGMAAPAARH